MTDLLSEALPTTWHGLPINADFRPMVWLASAYARREPEADPAAFAARAVQRFWRDPQRFLGRPDRLAEGYTGMLEFFRAGEDAAGAGQEAPDASAPEVLPFDYRCDAPYILAGFQRLYRIDLTTERIHWFRFRALLRGLIGEECMFSRIIDWRCADLAEKTPEERQFYERQRAAFALPQTLRGGAVHARTLGEHEAAFLARFR